MRCRLARLWCIRAFSNPGQTAQFSPALFQNKKSGDRQQGEKRGDECSVSEIPIQTSYRRWLVSGVEPKPVSSNQSELDAGFTSTGSVQVTGMTTPDLRISNYDKVQ
jgi:hypothetical protein